jgi:hypothetical protein
MCHHLNRSQTMQISVEFKNQPLGYLDDTRSVKPIIHQFTYFGNVSGMKLVLL